MGKTFTVKAHIVKSYTKTLKDAGKSFNPISKKVVDPNKPPALTGKQISDRKSNVAKLSKSGLNAAKTLIKSLKK